jgi:hypothetical protein
MNYQGPKGIVIEVVNMAVHLSPVQVVMYRLESGIGDDPTIKRGWVEEQLAWKEGVPVEEIASSEIGHHS